jgi:hypothetical protein
LEGNDAKGVPIGLKAVGGKLLPDTVEAWKIFGDMIPSYKTMYL